jgi:outer membrane lipoprotein-sorting protein
MKIKRLFLLFIIFCFSQIFLYSQDELIGAKELLEKFSNSFKANIKDYQADIKWSQDSNSQKGVVYFKNPQKLRINFTEPSGQVICSNGYLLWVYIENLNLLLKQEILQKDKVKGADGKMRSIINPILLNPVGYDRFISDYSVEYQDVKTKVDYKDGSKVYRLKLIRWRSLRGGFNTLLVTVQENGLIRRVEGITANYRHLVLEIDNIKTNINVNDMIFNYEPPAHVNTVENFISNQGDN